MCLIINKRANQSITPEFFMDVWKRNNDGVGMTWLNRRGQPTMWKSLDIKEFLKKYEVVKHKELLIHFRYTTDGETSLENAHPHKVIDDVYMVHNGCFNKYRTNRNDKNSDTVRFINELVVPMLNQNGGAPYLRSEEFLREIRTHTGQSKIAFMDSKGIIVPEPNLWKRTLSGLMVSNDYAFTVDSPNHQAGYASQQRKTYYEDEPRYGGMGHNSQYVGNAYDDDLDDTEEFLRQQLGAESQDNKQTVTPKLEESTIRKEPVLTLAKDNSKSKKELDVKSPNSKGIILANYTFLAEASDSEIRDLFNVDTENMVKVFKEALNEVLEYGYSQEKFRLSGN